MTNKLYDILKFIAQILLPLVATFYLTISNIWNLPYPEQISSTIMAVDTLLGGILLKLSSDYHKSNGGEDNLEHNQEFSN